MAISFNNAEYLGAAASVGQVGTVGASYYTGQQNVGNNGFIVNGTINGVGSTVSVQAVAAGIPGVAGTYTYDGYFNVNGQAVYVFTFGAGTSIGNAIAFSSVGTQTAVPVENLAQLTAGLPICFLRGTLIATPDGEVAVETLKAGDLVATLSDGEIVFKAATWIGSRKANVKAGSTDLDAFPVRIRANAVRDGAPSRDLLVTPEHCLFIDGKFVPARMLVNGSSIVVDTSITSYEYFHVELAQHGVLIAEGLETESYLDTGNRGNFITAAVPNLRPDFTVDTQSWAEHGAAPLATDRETVEPIWAALSARAATLGLVAEAPATIDNEPELRILTAGGVEIRPASVEGNGYSFVVPADAGALRLLSRTFRPSDAIGPFVDDRRTLGVFVGKIGLTVDGVHSDVSAHLVDAELAGWHPVEGATRWTAGDALLPVDLTGAQGTATLTIEVVTTGLYRTEAAKIAA